MMRVKCKQFEKPTKIDGLFGNSLRIEEFYQKNLPEMLSFSGGWLIYPKNFGIMWLMIQRTTYLNKLRLLKDTNLIKVVTGIRRAGKSTLLQMFRQELVNSGVDIANTQYINFEDPQYSRMNDWASIYDLIVSKLQNQAQNYIFLDEVQNIAEFEKMVDGLFIKENVDLYITGSNAYFLSSDLATILSGRYIEIKVLPLSFSEYNGVFKDELLSKSEKFDRYIQYGAFPEVSNFIKNGLESQINDYLISLYKTIVEKDILQRYRLKSDADLDKLLKFVIDSVGSLISINNIKNTINNERDFSEKIGIDKVDRYLEALVAGYIVYKVDRYNIKGKEVLKTLDKYYAVDTGFRRVLLGKEYGQDLGHTLENIVYLELIRRGNQVFVGKVDEHEVDFIARTKDGEIQYYQVADSMSDERVRTRELQALEKIKDHNQKFVLTRDNLEVNYNGIKQINVIDWLLEETNSQL